MSSIIRQIELLPAGCQPWNLNMVASCGTSFVYCATLAVYIYEYNAQLGEYMLTSINASHSKTITCIAWNKDKPSLFATAGADEKICVWNVKHQKCVATYENLGFTPISIGWIPGKDGADVLVFCGKHGNAKLWNMKDDSKSQVDHTAGFDHEVTLFKWHHTDPSKFVFGHIDGSLSLYNSGKRNRHAMKGHIDSSEKSLDPVLAALWDPLSVDYLLVARKSTGIQLIDVKAMVVINRFHLPSKMVSAITISWLDSAPGMFVTGDHESGVLRVWSVSQTSSLENINLKSTGFQSLCVLDVFTKDANQGIASGHVLQNSSLNKIRSGSVSSLGNHSYSVPPGRVVCAFADGGVGLFNLQMKKWEFLRDQGHIETIFDCKFKPNNSTVLATASFDGTVKVWSAIHLTPLATSTGNEGIIYSLSWAPGDQNCIACGTRRRGIFIWDIDKSKFVKRFKDHGSYAVYCVAWNQKDAQQLASCSDDATCVVRMLDSNDVKVFRHPDSTFGCDWSMFDKNVIATSCNDSIVRVWSTTKTDKPLYSLIGHSAKVFNVRWHPLIENILCSGSDDKTIRVWAVKSETCTGILHGHTSPVRGLCWNFEVPFILVSGSWDSSIRLWDIRDGKCIETIFDHGADVYGLATHYNKPFTIATSSRDSTLRIWSLDPMMKLLLLKIIAGFDLEKIFAPPENIMQRNSPIKVSGILSKQLVQQVQDKKSSDVSQLRQFSELFSSSKYIENFWDLIGVLSGQKESSLSASYKNGIMHTKHLTKYKSAEAHQAERAQAGRSSFSSGQSRSRELPLMRVAKLYLELGNMQRHCDLLVQLGQWERALALAPSVSLAYWSKLAIRYADMLRNDEADDATNFYIATGYIREAVKYLTFKNNYHDALLLAQTAVEGNSPPLVKDYNPSSAIPDASYADLVTDCCSELAERSYNTANPLKAACFYLAYSDITFAVDCLVKSNKLALALCISLNMKKSFDSTIEAARMLARSCEVKEPFLAVKLLQRYDPDCATSGDEWSALYGVCARCDNDSIKDKLHKFAEVPVPEVCDNMAAAAKNEGKMNVALKYFALGRNRQQTLQLGVELLKSRLGEDANWILDDVMSDLKAAFSIPTATLQLQSNTPFRTQLLAISAYFGVLYAYRRKYFGMLRPMFEYAISLCELSLRYDKNFPLLPSYLKDEMRAVAAAEVSEKEQEILCKIQCRAGEEPLQCMCGSTVANASNLPAHSELYTSTISKTKIDGAVFMLEDKRTTLSINEAIMWARCNEFSPTSSGARICPF